MQGSDDDSPFCLYEGFCPWCACSLRDRERCLCDASESIVDVEEWFESDREHPPGDDIECGESQHHPNVDVDEALSSCFLSADISSNGPWFEEESALARSLGASESDVRVEIKTERSVEGMGAQVRQCAADSNQVPTQSLRSRRLTSIRQRDQTKDERRPVKRQSKRARRPLCTRRRTPRRQAMEQHIKEKRLMDQRIEEQRIEEEQRLMKERSVADRCWERTPDQMFREILKMVHLPQRRVARILGISHTNVCKRWRWGSGDRRWPFRSLKKVNRAIALLDLKKETVSAEEYEERMALLQMSKRKLLNPLGEEEEK